jgi:diguanylate cyclase (GGDEF)-like protein
MNIVALDPGTLVTTIVFVLVVLAGLLALSWVQNRGVPELGMWAICFGLCAAAGALWAARESLPEFLSFNVANALRLAAFGLAWQAARRFAGEPGNWALAFAPSVLWLAVSWLPPFDEAGRARLVLSSLLIGVYALAIAAELWRGSRKGLRMARPAAIVLGLHGMFFLGRAAANLVLPEPHFGLELGASAGPHPLVLLESLMVALALAFLIVSAAKEQLEVKHREASLIDPLTGIANRRGFSIFVEQMLARARRDGSAPALLLLDLDHFKAVNDNWGHQVGDRALQAVARTVEQQVRAGDVVARLGGEELAVALALSRIDQAAVLAERVRRAVAALDISRGEVSLRLTVSIGVAAFRPGDSLDGLVARADAALYRAKANGRNRVEFAPPPIAVAGAAVTPAARAA